MKSMGEETEPAEYTDGQRAAFRQLIEEARKPITGEARAMWMRASQSHREGHLKHCAGGPGCYAPHYHALDAEQRMADFLDKRGIWAPDPLPFKVHPTPAGLQP